MPHNLSSHHGAVVIGKSTLYSELVLGKSCRLCLERLCIASKDYSAIEPLRTAQEIRNSGQGWEDL